MRKRLRKKLHLGEFQELGFTITFELAPNVSQQDRNQLILDFVRHGIEAQGLACGGGGSGPTWECFATVDAPRGSATEAHRATVARWLESHALVARSEVGPLTDAWQSSGQLA